MAAEPAPAPLPSATVLNYLSRTDLTPTRVRLIAARGVWVMAVVYLLLALGAAYTVISILLSLYTAGMSFAWIRIDLARQIPRLLVLGVSLTVGILCACLAGGVKRGRSGPAIVTMIAAIPGGLLLLLIAVVMGTFALLDGVGIGGPKGGAAPVWLLLLIPTAVMVVLCLLVKDLCAFLFWIARHPEAEKPKIDFLSGRPRP